MNLIVTGGSGRIGRVTVKQLITHGHQVTILDRLAGAELAEDVQADIEGAQVRQVDITDYDALRPHFDGIDAVIHLAGLAHPGAGPGQTIFHINANGSFNVYQAAADAGIKRVVSASSINALGFTFGVKPSAIQYLPIDEEHPCSTTDAYSFGKQVLEQIAAYFWRRDGISGVCLRFPFVNVIGQHSPFSAEWAKRREMFQARLHADFEQLAGMPEAERKALVLDLIAAYDTEREERQHEIPWEARRRSGMHRTVPDEMPVGSMLISQRISFWAILDGRDAAQAIEKGVLADYEGSHPLYVNAANNTLGYPSAQLAAMAFPDVTVYKRPLQGTESLVSFEKARTLIGFEPDYGGSS